MTENGNGICKLHSGFEERIRDLEDNMKQVWAKWDRINTLLLVTLGGVIANLIIMLVKIGR